MTPSAPARRRLLFLSHRLPYPPHNGASIRTFNILRLLARDYDVVALCFDRRDAATGGMTQAERAHALGPSVSVEVFPIEQEWSSGRAVRDHARSLIARRAYTFSMHESVPFEDRLRHHLASGRFELAHIDSLDLVRFLPLLAGIPVACTHHNVESALLARRARSESNPFRRAYLTIQSRLLKREERAWLPRVTLNIAVSGDDAEAFARIAPGARFAVVPNGVDTEYFKPRDGVVEGCVFVGGTTWYPNRDALEWFATEILPRVRDLGCTAPVTWVGRSSDAERARYERLPGLRLTGYVDDVRPFLARAACFVAPLRVGGGTRLKLLDAWAMGKAVVSTGVGAEGLETAHGVNIVLADDAATFARELVQLLGDPERCRKIGVAARRTVETRYAWPVIGEHLRELYARVGARDQVAAA